MRINVYAEEITGTVIVTETTSRGGEPFFGLRVYLMSAPQLKPEDSSAVTFWFKDMAALNDFRQALYVNQQTARS